MRHVRARAVLIGFVCVIVMGCDGRVYQLDVVPHRETDSARQLILAAVDNAVTPHGLQREPTTRASGTSSSLVKYFIEEPSEWGSGFIHVIVEEPRSNTFQIRLGCFPYFDYPLAAELRKDLKQRMTDYFGDTSVRGF